MRPAVAAARGSGPWPYWCPDAGVDDLWKPQGYPAGPDSVARASAELVSQGLGFAWASLPGNHDLMRQGAALPEPEIERIAIGQHEAALRRPEDLHWPQWSSVRSSKPAAAAQFADGEAASRRIAYPLRKPPVGRIGWNDWFGASKIGPSLTFTIHPFDNRKNSKGWNVFKNVVVYRMVSEWAVTQAQLEEALQRGRFVACGASQEKSVGWVEPRGVAHGPLVEVVGGQWLLKQMVEVKAVPGAVVKRKVEEQVAQIEASTGRKPGKKEIRGLRDDTRLALLPMAFTKQSSVLVWIDPKARFLVLGAASQGKADEVVTGLIKAIDGLALQLVNTQTSPAVAMSAWLSVQQPPAGFSVDRECELKAADGSQAVVRYTRHALDTDDVSGHIAMGKVPTRLALTWNDRLSFVLTDALQLKKLAFLDVVLEGAPASPADSRDDGFESDAAIATGELGNMIPELLEALGGELA